MHTQPQQGDRDLQHKLVQKLSPINFPGMSGLMAAIVGYVLGVTFIEPRIAEIAITADGFVLARSEGDVGASHFLGRYADLFSNWMRLMEAAGLTATEFVECQSLFAKQIGFYGGTTA